MARNYRAEAEMTEKAVVSLLNGSPIPTEVQSEANEEAAQAIANRIDTKFPAINRAEHRGGRYDDIGDIKTLLDSGEELYFEIKVVGSGPGTLSNTGKELLAQYDLVENAPTWEEFREQQGFDDWRAQVLDQFEYPDLNGGPGTNKRRMNKGRHLKDLIGWEGGKTLTKANSVLNDPTSSEEERRAAEAIQKIYERAHQGKLDYIDYIREKEQNEDNIRRLAILLFCGYHTSELIESHWETPLDELETHLTAYRIAYYVTERGSCYIKNPLDYIDYLRGANFHIQFSDEQTSVKLVVEHEGETQPFLRISLNWKNVFQGVGTASANSFLCGPAKDPNWVSET